MVFHMSMRLSSVSMHQVRFFTLTMIFFIKGMTSSSWKASLDVLEFVDHDVERLLHDRVQVTDEVVHGFPGLAHIRQLGFYLAEFFENEILFAHDPVS